jgi:hypothetical protein
VRETDTSAQRTERNDEESKPSVRMEGLERKIARRLKDKIRHQKTIIAMVYW